MSIAKPTFRPPWSSAVPANMEDPGGVAPNGIPAEGKSIPRRWLNWILNQIDSGVAYLMARGISDYEATETYSPGDKVQHAGTTYTQIHTGDTTGVAPNSDPTMWQRWGYTSAEFANAFASALTAAFPGLLAAQFGAPFAAGLGACTFVPSSGALTPSPGTVSDALAFKIAAGWGGGSGYMRIRFKLTDFGTPSGICTVTFSGAALFTGPVSVQVTAAQDVNTSYAPQADADVDNDAIVISYPPGFTAGSHPTIWVDVAGVPA